MQYITKPKFKLYELSELSAEHSIEKEHSTYILGLYFFYGDSHTEHSKILFNILDLLAKFGGLYGSIF